MWEGILILSVGLFIWPLLFASYLFLNKFDKDLEDIFPLIRKQNSYRHCKNNTVYFPSRRSAILTIVLWVILLSSLAITANSGQLSTFLIILIMSMLTLWLEATTGYTINSTHLIIQWGIFRSKVNLDGLTNIKKTNNPISAPALSLKRIEITTKDGDLILISPVEEEYFLKLLSERSPNLVINWKEFKNTD